MKNILFYITFFFFSVTGYSQLVAIPDANFRMYLSALQSGLINGNGYMDITKAETFDGPIICQNLSIASLEGIQYFTRLKVLNCSFNKLESLPDLSSLLQLEQLNCSNNQLKIFPVLGQKPSLSKIYADYNQLTSIPTLSSLYNLVELKLNNNNLESLPSLQGIAGVNILDVHDNKLTALPNLTYNTVLIELICYNNQLTTIPSLSTNNGLRLLDCSRNKLVSIVSFPSNSNSLLTINCSNNQLSSLPALNHILSLKRLYCQSNKLSQLPALNGLTFLEVILCGNNKLSALPAMTGCQLLANIDADSNEFHVSPDLSQLPALTHVNFSYNQIETIYELVSPSGTGLQSMDLSYNKLSFEDLVLYAQHDTTVFHFFPQRPFSIGGPVQLREGESYVLSLPFDQNINSNLYSWQADGKTFDVTSTGNYELRNSINISAVITNPAFSGKSLTTTTLSVYTNSCANANCDEFVLSPNGDGVGDLYRIEQAGLIEIMNREGRIVKSMTGPAIWTGDENTTGYFLVFLNGKKIAAVTLVR